MFFGRYIRWNPVPALEGKRMYCEAVHDDCEDVRIWLRPDFEGPMLVVKFSISLFYASSDERHRLAQTANDVPLSFPHVFWVVEESALLAEFHRQSVGTQDDLKITHYAFLSASSCIDVLSIEPPSFEGWDT
jgi:hypothetical protein